MSRKSSPVTPAEIGRLTDETIRLSVRLGETAGLLVVAMQYVWLDGWVLGRRQATAGVEEMLAAADAHEPSGPPRRVVLAARGLHLV